jgi:hypothetical protein
VKVGVVFTSFRCTQLVVRLRIAEVLDIHVWAIMHNTCLIDVHEWISSLKILVAKLLVPLRRSDICAFFKDGEAIRISWRDRSISVMEALAFVSCDVTGKAGRAAGHPTNCLDQINYPPGRVRC